MEYQHAGLAGFQGVQAWEWSGVRVKSFNKLDEMAHTDYLIDGRQALQTDSAPRGYTTEGPRHP